MCVYVCSFLCVCVFSPILMFGVRFKRKRLNERGGENERNEEKERDEERGARGGTRRREETSANLPLYTKFTSSLPSYSKNQRHTDES